MECHKCPHGAAVFAGLYRFTAFEKTPCVACTPETGPSFAQAYNDGLEAAADVLCDSPGVPEEAFPEEAVPESELAPAVSLSSMFPVGAFLHGLMALFELSDKDLAVLRLRYRGLSRAQVATRLNLTEKAVVCRFDRVLRRYPVLLALFPERRQGSFITMRKRGGIHAKGRENREIAVGHGLAGS